MPRKKHNPKPKAPSSHIGIIGLGYVGLPLACLFAEKGCSVTGFDIDPNKAEKIQQGKSYIEHIPHARLKPLIASKNLQATSDFSELQKQDCIIACVPTPLTRHHEPDLSFVRSTAQSIAKFLRRGQLIVFESTTYPGTNKEVVQPILEESGLLSGKDFFLAYSPEREDPGNPRYSTASIPKIVGADHPSALKKAVHLYRLAIDQVIPVSSSAAAEATKLTENIFRAVNIALVNELKVIYDSMGIDIWEVIEAAKTKPFGFMPFYPGPGWGGHCIPIDPFYLSWKAREYGHRTRFIELAGEINTQMPQRIVQRLASELSLRQGKPLKSAHILLIGLAYKKNVDDMRESPALVIWELLKKAGAKISYHDPHIPKVKSSRDHPELTGQKSVALSTGTLKKADAILILTDHDRIDYGQIAGARLILDTRNAMERHGYNGPAIVKA